MWVLILVLVVLALAAVFVLAEDWGPVAPIRRRVVRRRVVHDHFHDYGPDHTHERPVTRTRRRTY